MVAFIVAVLNLKLQLVEIYNRICPTLIGGGQYVRYALNILYETHYRTLSCIG
jgi:hypothetical protein